MGWWKVKSALVLAIAVDVIRIRGTNILRKV